MIHVINEQKNKSKLVPKIEDLLNSMILGVYGIFNSF